MDLLFLSFLCLSVCLSVCEWERDETIFAKGGSSSSNWRRNFLQKKPFFMEGIWFRTSFHFFFLSVATSWLQAEEKKKQRLICARRSQRFCSHTHKCSPWRLCQRRTTFQPCLMEVEAFFYLCSNSGNWLSRYFLPPMALPFHFSLFFSPWFSVDEESPTFFFQKGLGLLFPNFGPL